MTEIETEVPAEVPSKTEKDVFKKLRYFGGFLIVLAILSVGIFTAVISSKQSAISELKKEKAALVEENAAYEKECQEILANKIVSLGYYATSDYTLREAIRTLLSGDVDGASTKIDSANDLQAKAREYAAKDDRRKSIDCQGGETN